MLYAVICRDKPDHLKRRLDNRAAHLDYIERTGIVKMAGPFIEGGQMCGTLAIIEADSLDAAQAWVAGDPYGAAGLFEEVKVIEWKRVIG